MDLFFHLQILPRVFLTRLGSRVFSQDSLVLVLKPAMGDSELFNSMGNSGNNSLDSLYLC